MTRSNFGAVRLPLLGAAVLASFAVSLSAQVVERGRTYADLVATHPCNSGNSGRLARVTDAQSSSSIGGGGGSTQVWAVCDGVDTWTLTDIGGGGGLPGADQVTESMLKAVNAATDEYVLTYESTVGDFEWQAAATGTIGGSTGATDNAILRADGVGGVTAQSSAVTIADTTGNLQWEGTTADDFEGNFTFADPTADWTWTWSGSGQVLAPLGSESLPSYSFAGSVDTGFYGTGSTIYATVSSVSKLRINANGTSILHGWLFGSGDPNNRLFGFTKWVSASTAGSGAPEVADPIFGMGVNTNEGTAEQNYRSLPPAAAGYQFTFVVQDADGIRVVAAAGDTIRIAGTASATAGYAQSTTIGSALTLVAINATEWVAISSLGTWTIDS